MDVSKAENVAFVANEPCRISILSANTKPNRSLSVPSDTNRNPNAFGVFSEFKNGEQVQLVKNQATNTLSKFPNPNTASSCVGNERKSPVSSNDAITSPEHPTCHSCQYKDLFNIVLKELIDERSKRKEQENQQQKQQTSVPSAVEMSLEYKSKREKRPKSGFKKWWSAITTWNYGKK